MSAPVVSVCCITFNHCNYIRQCLDGFLMQKTSFPIEIIVHDDASTDGTQDIVKEYALKYSDLFKIILQDENQYSKGVDVLNIVFERAKGKYIALCEGDDYWTDPLKLQKQVDFLEGNSEYSICGHRFIAYDEKEARYYPFNNHIDNIYNLRDLIYKHVFCSTLTLVFRKAALDVSSYLKLRCSLDLSLSYMLLKEGNGYCLPDEMAVYRIHSGGVWSGSEESTHIYKNLDIRIAIYEYERTYDAALFILTYISKLGRLWVITNMRIFLNAMKCLGEQFGWRAVFLFMMKFIFR